jgi:hypothetical protein
MNKTTNKYTPEVRERAVRMVLNGEGQHDSRWSAILSISSKIGCAPQTLLPNEPRCIHLHPARISRNANGAPLGAVSLILLW